MSIEYIHYRKKKKR